METEHLVIIATFNNVAHAEDAQVELERAGIYGLLMSSQPVDGSASTAPDSSAVTLAVNQRDANVARALLAPTLDASQ